MSAHERYLKMKSMLKATLAMQAEVDEGVRSATCSKNLATKLLDTTYSVKNSASMVLTAMETKHQQHVVRLAQLGTTLDDEASAILLKLGQQQSDATLLLTETITARDSISTWDERFQDQISTASTSFST